MLATVSSGGLLHSLTLTLTVKELPATSNEGRCIQYGDATMSMRSSRVLYGMAVGSVLTSRILRFKNPPPFRYDPGLQIPRLRYSPGLAPTTRLNALLNAASDS
jgi:hypothetical protein